MAVTTNINETMNKRPMGEVSSAGVTENGKAINESATIIINFAIAEAEKKYKIILEAKDQEISELKKLYEEKDKQNDVLIKRNEELETLKKNNGVVTVPLNPIQSQTKDYHYDSLLFPEGNADVIIDCVLELTKCKRERGKFVIKSKTDWYIVAKVLHYFKVFLGDEKEFLDNILENVKPYIEDDERKKKLSVPKDYFNSIMPNNPMKAIPVNGWRKAAIKERERMEEQKLNGDRRANAETVLNRCVNIHERLCHILINHDVQLANY